MRPARKPAPAVIPVAPSIMARDELAAIAWHALISNPAFANQMTDEHAAAEYAFRTADAFIARSRQP